MIFALQVALAYILVFSYYWLITSGADARWPSSKRVEMLIEELDAGGWWARAYVVLSFLPMIVCIANLQLAISVAIYVFGNILARSLRTS